MSLVTDHLEKENFATFWDATDEDGHLIALEVNVRGSRLTVYIHPFDAVEFGKELLELAGSM